MAVPNGWEEQPPVEGDPKRYYEAKIGNYIGTNGQSVSVFSRTDTAGNYQLYQSTPTSLLGSRELIYTYNQSDSKSGNRGLLSTTDFNNINTSVKQKSFEINRAVGSEGEKESLSNSKGYKSLAQSEPESTDNPPGPSDDDTSDGGVTPATESPFGTVATSEDFQGDNEFKHPKWLKYPIDMNSNQDRIFIVQKKYKSVVGKGGNFDDINFLDYNTLSRDRNAGRENILGSVTLPMPNDISETNVTAWGEDSLSTLAGMLGGSASKVAASISNADFGQTGLTAAQLFGKITDTPASEAIKQMLTLNAGAAIVNKFGVNFNAEAFRSRITGTAINSNLELLFQGPKLRSFGFQFKMTPRSQDEARNIRYILKFFRKGMASKRSEGQPFFLGAPNVFDIHFKSGEGNNDDLKSIGRIKTCALQQCVVNYTPDGFYAAFADQKAGGSQPISVVMQLAFTELTPIYNDEYIDDDNDSNSVGWDENSTFKYS